MRRCHACSRRTRLIVRQTTARRARGGTSGSIVCVCLSILFFALGASPSSSSSGQGATHASMRTHAVGRSLRFSGAHMRPFDAVRPIGPTQRDGRTALGAALQALRLAGGQGAVGMSEQEGRERGSTGMLGKRRGAGDDAEGNSAREDGVQGGDGDKKPSKLALLLQRAAAYSAFLRERLQQSQAACNTTASAQAPSAATGPGTTVAGAAGNITRDDRQPKLVTGAMLRSYQVGLRVQGSGCRVQGSGFRVQGSGCRVQGSGFRFWDQGSPSMNPQP